MRQPHLVMDIGNFREKKQCPECKKWFYSDKHLGCPNHWVTDDEALADHDEIVKGMED